MFGINCSLIFINILVLVYGTLSSNTKEETCENCNPLLLTPLINEGKLIEARIKAEVKFDDFKNVKSYSGYFTVSEQFNSNLFFWFFPSESNYEEAPVILWLQGGPGAPLFLGVFLEHGPFSVTNNKTELRQDRWNKNHSMLYIDSPVGTGYSFTNLDGYAQNQTIIAEHLYRALMQFFKVFPEIQNNQFFVSGESYGGKYVPAIAYKISQENPKASQIINLQGLMIGNGFSDPEHQIKYSELFFQNGLIDLNTKSKVEAMENKVIECIRKKDWEKAHALYTEMVLNRSSLINSVSGFTCTYNLLNPQPFPGDDIYKYYLNNDVQTALHVHKREFYFDYLLIEKKLVYDMMQSVSSWIEKLLEQYRVLIYHGQLDHLVSYSGTINYINHLNFTGLSEYKNATRQKWFVNDTLAGYVKRGGNLIEVLVRNAGHMVPKDQPAWALYLITRFTRSRSLD